MRSFVVGDLLHEAQAANARKLQDSAVAGHAICMSCAPVCLVQINLALAFCSLAKAFYKKFNPEKLSDSGCLAPLMRTEDSP